MPLADSDLVIRVLGRPEALLDFQLADFDLLLRQAARADLLARLALQIEAAGLRGRVPPAFAAHLDGSLRKLRAHRAEVRREVAFLLQALKPLDVPLLLLKGGAYVLADLPAAQGRLFSDLDILVPKARLTEVESALMQHGWTGTHHDAYDQRYYRQWMHELPPLVHLARATALDVHHTLTPETSRWPVDASLLLADAVPVPGHPGCSMLAPTDMVLHSIVHLLLNDDLSHGLRDLSDIDLLLRHFGTAAGFWAHLTRRAAALGLVRALGHGLLLVHGILATPVPDSVMADAASAAPANWRRRLLHAAWHRMLRTPHPTAADGWTPLAAFALYVRAHAMRMPAGLLTRHLLTKAIRRRSADGPTDR